MKRTGGIRGSRNRQANQIGTACRCSVLQHHPTSSGLVVLHDRVAAVLVLAESAESTPKGVAICGTVLERPILFVINRKLGVDPLHYLRCADRQIRIPHEPARVTDTIKA